MTRRDYYEVLEISRSASDDEIKRAYRQVAKKYHPDLNPDNHGAEERFKEAAEAYEVLRDPEKRRIYDQFGHEGLKGRGFQGFSGMEDVFSNFGDIFDSFFGFGTTRGRRRTGPVQGQDLETRLRISFREAVFGTTREIDVERETGCDSCKGSGVTPGSDVQTCPQCGGKGQVAHNQGFFSIATTCPRCRGTGAYISHPCADCRGAGRKLERKKVDVEIPAGVDERVRIRLAHEGEGGYRGGPAGDLYVGLVIEKDAHFRREEEHLYTDLSIGVAQAALGTTVRLETLDGAEEVSIPKGSQNGDMVKVAGKGVPRLRKTTRGDLFVQIHVAIPRRMTQRQEELLREFAEEGGEAISPPREGIFKRLKKKKG